MYREGVLKKGYIDYKRLARGGRGLLERRFGYM